MKADRRSLRKALALCTLSAVLLFGLVGVGSGPASATTQVIAARTSQTNLPTETVWPGLREP